MSAAGSVLSQHLNSAAASALLFCWLSLLADWYVGCISWGLGQLGSASYASCSLVGGLRLPRFVRRGGVCARMASGWSASSSFARTDCRSRAASSWRETGMTPVSRCKLVRGVVFQTGRTALRAWLVVPASRLTRYFVLVLTWPCVVRLVLPGHHASAPYR